MSSWGYKGYSEVWLKASNDWIYRHLHEGADRMVELAGATSGRRTPLHGARLNQAARELLLAQSSDWAFIMKTGTMVSTPSSGPTTTWADFTRLYEQIRSGSVDERWLADVEGRDNIFPWLDYRVYASRPSYSGATVLSR